MLINSSENSYLQRIILGLSRISSGLFSTLFLTSHTRPASKTTFYQMAPGSPHSALPCAAEPSSVGSYKVKLYPVAVHRVSNDCTIARHVPDNKLHLLYICDPDNHVVETLDNTGFIHFRMYLAHVFTHLCKELR